MVRATLNDSFRSLAGLKGEYLVYDDGYRPRSYSYAECVRAARNFAARLESAGIGRGDKVILWSENRPEWVAAFWGCVLRGVAVTPIDERHSLEFLDRVERIVAPKAILSGDEVHLGERTGGAPVWRLTELDWDAVTSFNEVQNQPEDIAEILFTSGATADPKGVLITHRNILANTVPVETEIQKYRLYSRPFSPIRFLNLLPLSHMFGQAMAIFIPPMLAGTVVFQRSQNPAEIVRQIKTRRISVLVSVPKILEVLKEYVEGLLPVTQPSPPRREGVARRWWRYRAAHRLFGIKFWSCIVGGAALDPKLEEFFGRLGFLVIQGYGLTEAAPIVTLNHPFHARKGTVGKPIHGVEIRIAEDGEVLVRGGNVSTGYFNNASATAEAFGDGWLHTGDIGSLDEDGRLQIRGRKKEMIVLPDGRNVFPEDVERVLNGLAGVRESAVVGLAGEGGERVHAVLALEEGAAADEILRRANAALEEHQKIRGCTVWSEGDLPRTEGTRKLKRREIRGRVSGEIAAKPAVAVEGVDALLARWTGGRTLESTTTLDDLGLSSLDKVELLVSLEQKLGTSIDEAAFAQARTVADLDALRRHPVQAGPVEPIEFPAWNRHPIAHWSRVFHLNVWLLRLAQVFAWVRVEGRENLRGLKGPLLFASNHQSYFDTPVILLAMPWKWRHRLAPAMRKEFFEAHFQPRKHGWWKWFTNSLNYYLACLMFNALPIPQRDAGTRQTLRYLGELVNEGWCPLIFPEGKHSPDETIGRFQAGVAMMAVRLNVPVVPIRLFGVNRILHPSRSFPRPGIVMVKIGAPIILEGDDFAALAQVVEDRVRSM